MLNPTESRHSFGDGDLVSDADGRRGLVHEASALYAVIRWEDGREEEVEQNDPRVVVETREEGCYAVRVSFDLWSKAGPKLEEKPHGAESDRMREAA